MNGSQLTIQNTTEDDDGAYVCQGTNQMAMLWEWYGSLLKLLVSMDLKNKQTDQQPWVKQQCP